MNVLDYLKKLRNKLTNNKVYLVPYEKIGFKTENHLEENNDDIVKLQDEEELVLLENATKEFFPKSGLWTSVCFQRPKEYGIGYLPCHTRDEEWLAHTLQITKNLNNIDFQKILNFIKTSELFQKERHDYEQRVVAWQIKWMVSGGDGWIVREEYGDDFILWDDNCDIGFRLGIVDTLTKIGMPEDAIEEGIEVNAHLWRNILMKKAFNNQYNQTFDLISYEIEHPEEEHQNIWIKWRKYEYYQRHKKSVELYSPRDYSSDNIFSPNINDLKLTEEEATEIYNYLLIKNEERKNYIEECKKDPAKKKKLDFFVDFSK